MTATMPAATTITIEEVERHAPDILLPPDPEFADAYASSAERGREAAKDASVAFVAICRNAMPWLPRTLDLVERTGAMFREWSCYIYENDSIDGTKDTLAAWHDGTQRVASLRANGRPHLNTTTAPVRTHALAEYRAACQAWVKKNSPHADYVIVFDTDPWGGWSVDGVMTSVDLLGNRKDGDGYHEWYGLASYSWAEWLHGSTPLPFHYDAFAARLNHWTRRDQNWFHLWHPPVGAPPVPFCSAFGQLAIYHAHAYLTGTYSGEDCEHVRFHRSIQRHVVGQFGINPSMRCVSFWHLGDEARGG